LSSADQAAAVLRKMQPEDWILLQDLEKALDAHEFVPLGYLVKVTGAHKDEVEYRLQRLNEAKLIAGSPKGVTLLTAGLDAIALNALVRKGLISGMGRALGVGKEADIFEVISELGDVFVVKFYRIGRTSFQAVTKKRSYSTPLRHSWFMVNIGAAKREFEALKRIHPLGASVPEAIAKERHAILMKKIEGKILPEWLELPEPPKVLTEILTSLRIAFTKASIVNSDLSEFNILFDGEKPWIIDWPQAVPTSHPNASILLDRDVMSILRFFRRRFKVECHLESATFYVRGWREKFPVL
jgi:RIO kinase 2